MRGRAPLSRRLALGLSGGLAALWLLAITATGLTLRHEMQEAFDSNLSTTARRLIALAPAVPEDAAPVGPLPVAGDEEYLAWVLRDGSGAVLAQSHEGAAAALPAPARPGFGDGNGMRLLAVDDPARGLHLVLGESEGHRREALLNSAGTLLIPLALLIPLSFAGVVFWVRRSLRPVARLRDDLAQRGAGDLSAVAAGDLPREVAVIADQANALMARLAAALEAERGFTANAAHELRTPIAAALAQTQRLAAELPPDLPADSPLAARAATIADQLRRLSRLAEKLMHLARAEGGGVLADSRTDLAPVLALVADEFRRAGQGARLRLDLPEGGAAPQAIDPDAFAILARNLIDNALRHSPEGSPVTVAMDAQSSLRIVNDGPPVPPETRAGLTRRFARGASRADGSGLGLAIAATIAARAGARLDLVSPVPGRAEGFLVTLRFAPPV